jgi:hypothetical protein
MIQIFKKWKIGQVPSKFMQVVIAQAGIQVLEINMTHLKSNVRRKLDFQSITKEIRIYLCRVLLKIPKEMKYM